jgi:hypothetical protein
MKVFRQRSSRTTSLTLAGLLGVAACGILAVPAQAQYGRYPRSYACTNLALAQWQANAWRARAYYYASYSYGGYAYASYPPANPVITSYVDPDGGYLGGSAALIDAQGNYLIQHQQAKLVREQARQAEIDTRRKAFDERRYEQANTPTLEEVRMKARMEQVRRSRFDPPVTEIYSAKALNDLLFSLQRLQGAKAWSRSVPLDPSILQQINATPGGTNAICALLKDGGKLQWPAALKSSTFDAGRQRMEQLLPQALEQARSGKIDAETLTSLSDTIEALEQQLKEHVVGIPVNPYIEARRYLHALDDSVKALQGPAVANHINGTWQAKGSTVAELVDYMTRHGLQFAPAVRGQEAAYVALQRAMADYDTELLQRMDRPSERQ